MTGQKKLVLFLGVMGALLVAVLIVALSSGDEPGKAKFSPELKEEFAREGVPEDVQREMRTGQSGEQSLMIKRRRLIAGVNLEKQQVCPGEDVLIKPAKTDVSAPVQFRINLRTRGEEAILTFKEPGKRKLYITAGDGRYGVDFATAQIEVLSDDHPDCKNKPRVALTSRISRFQADSADLEVVAAKGLGDNLSYAWEFGDGTTQQGPQKFVTHSYQQRDQEKPSSTFIVRVTVTDSQGNHAAGRTSVTFNNTYFLARINGAPALPVSYDRFPKRDGSTYRTTITFRNIERTTIALSNATVKVHSCKEGPEPEAKNVSVTSLISTTNLPAGRSVSQTLTLPASAVGDAGGCRAEITFVGDTVPGRLGQPVGPNIASRYAETTATVFLELEPPPGTDKGGMKAAAPVPVRDQETLDKLQKARAILGRDQVTPQDILELEKQGKLK